MRVHTSLPPNFVKSTVLEPSKDRSFVLHAILTGIALLLIFGWLLASFADAIRPAALDGLRLRDLIRSTSTASTFAIPAALFRDLVLALAAVLIAHEFVHGLFYWLLSMKRPKVGIRGLFPYAAAPAGVYFPRNGFITIGLAPLVLLTGLGLLLIATVPLSFVGFILFFVAFNATGAGGDLVMALRLLSFSEAALIEDNDAGVTVYEPPDKKSPA